MVVAQMLIDAVLLLFLGAFVTLTIVVAARLFRSPARVAQFEACYVSVNARVLDSCFWASRHVLKALRDRGSARARMSRTGLALLVGGLTIAVPLTAIAASGDGDVGRHGVYAAVGALLWACLLEGAGIGERLNQQVGSPIVATPLWALVVVFLVFDLVVGFLALSGVFVAGPVRAAAIGAGFVAIADAISIVLGFYLSAWTPYLLADPP